MRDNILHMFDCWADPVVNLFLFKSSIAELAMELEIKKPFFIDSFFFAIVRSSNENPIMTSEIN